MAEVTFPGQHTTSTTVTSNTVVQTDIRFDSTYIRTVPGMLKAAAVVLNLLGFICIMASHYDYSSQGRYFTSVSMVGFWFTGVLLCLYLFHVVEKFYKIPWLQMEMIFCPVWAFLYLIAASIAVSLPVDAFKAAGFFGFGAMLVYAIDGYLKWRAVRAGGLAQGTRVVTKETTRVTTPPSREGY